MIWVGDRFAMSECLVSYSIRACPRSSSRPRPRPRPRNLARLIKMTPSAQSILRVPSSFPLIAPYPARPRFGRLSLDAFVLLGILAERQGRLVCGPRPLVFGPCPRTGFLRLRITHRPGVLPSRRLVEKVRLPGSSSGMKYGGKYARARGLWSQWASCSLDRGRVGAGWERIISFLRGCGFSWER